MPGRRRLDPLGNLMPFQAWEDDVRKQQVNGAGMLARSGERIFAIQRLHNRIALMLEDCARQREQRPFVLDDENRLAANHV